MSDHGKEALDDGGSRREGSGPDFLTLPITGEFDHGWLLQFEGRVYLDGRDADVEQGPVSWTDRHSPPNPDHPLFERLAHRTWVCGAEYLARVRCRLTAPTPKAVPANDAPPPDPRLALGAAAVLSPTQAAELLPGREAENMRWLRDAGLVRSRHGLPDVVIIGDVLEALRSGATPSEATAKPRPTLRRARIN